jgi:sugar phosphate permease
VGSLGAILEGIVIGIIADTFGWGAVLHFIAAISTLCIALLYRVQQHLRL